MTNRDLLLLADVVLEREYRRDVARRHLLDAERELGAARARLDAARRAAAEPTADATPIEIRLVRR